MKAEYRFWIMQAICFCLAGATNAEYAIAYLVMLIPLNISAYFLWSRLKAAQRGQALLEATVWLSPIALFFIAFPLAVCISYAIARQ